MTKKEQVLQICIFNPTVSMSGEILVCFFPFPLFDQYRIAIYTVV